MHAHLRPITIPRGWRVATPAWVLAAFCLMMVGAWLISHWPLPWPECGLRWLTGLPCPACGCTRSLLAWTELDLTAAFLFNPLFFLLCVVSVVSGAWRLLRRSRSGAGNTEPQSMANHVGQTSCLPVQAASCRLKHGARMPHEPSGWKPDPHFPTGSQHLAPFPWLPWLTWRRAGVLLVLNWLYLCGWLPK